jgi:hypothetical protein
MSTVATKRELADLNRYENRRQARRLNAKKPKRPIRNAVAKAPKSRTSTTAPMMTCINAGFELCTTLICSPSVEQVLLDEVFFKWTAHYERSMPMLRGRSSPSNTNITPSNDIKYIMSLNKRFASSILRSPYNENVCLHEAVHATIDDCAARYNYWIPWVYIAPTTRCRYVPGNRHHGLFAARKFKKGDIVGVYMGEKTSSNTVDAYSIKLKVKVVPTTVNDKDGNDSSAAFTEVRTIVDAKGGIDSGAPLWLGIHYINDPTDPADEGCEVTLEEKQNKWNIEIFSNGIAHATKTIEIGDELFMDYDREIVDLETASSDH